MIRYSGGMVAEKGFYWSPADGWRVDMMEGEVLPGSAGKSYLKISPLLLLAIAPFVGMTFLFFLPLFGIGVLFVLSLLPAYGIFSAITTTALRVSASKAEKTNGAENKIFIGNYRPSGASFTAHAKKRKSVSKRK